MSKKCSFWVKFWSFSKISSRFQASCHRLNLIYMPSYIAKNRWTWEWITSAIAIISWSKGQRIGINENLRFGCPFFNYLSSKCSSSSSFKWKQFYCSRRKRTLHLDLFFVLFRPGTLPFKMHTFSAFPENIHQEWKLIQPKLQNESDFNSETWMFLWYLLLVLTETECLYHLDCLIWYGLTKMEVHDRLSALRSCALQNMLRSVPIFATKFAKNWENERKFNVKIHENLIFINFLHFH